MKLAPRLFLAAAAFAGVSTADISNHPIDPVQQRVVKECGNAEKLTSMEEFVRQFCEVSTIHRVIQEKHDEILDLFSKESDSQKKSKIVEQGLLEIARLSAIQQEAMKAGGVVEEPFQRMKNVKESRSKG